MQNKDVKNNVAASGDNKDTAGLYRAAKKPEASGPRLYYQASVLSSCFPTEKNVALSQHFYHNREWWWRNKMETEHKKIQTENSNF